MNSTALESSHYTAASGDEYLAQRQAATSQRVQKMRSTLFADLATEGATILDFGCGTGGLLSNLDCRRRIGIEIGSRAAEQARSNGLEVHSNLDEVEDRSVDLAISFHAIEHVPDPLSILEKLRRSLKPGGRVRLIVPGEDPRDPRQAQWSPNEDMHLFTWTPLIFGNLAKLAGYDNIKTRIEPMPTGSRAVRYLRIAPPLSRWAHRRVATRLNAWNVIFDGTSPA